MRIALVVGRIEHKTGIARSALEVASNLAKDNNVTIVGPVDPVVIKEFSNQLNYHQIGFNNYIRPKTLRSDDTESIEENRKESIATINQSKEINEYLLGSDYDIIDNWGNWSSVQDVATCRFCFAEYATISENRNPIFKKTKTSDMAKKTVLFLEKERFKYPGTKMIIANSKKVLKEITSNYPSISAPIKVVYNGINTKKYSFPAKEKIRIKIRSKYQVPDDKRIILSVSTHAERKNLELLLSAFPLLQNKDNIELWIVGVTSNEGKYSDKNIRYFDKTDNTEEFYSAADIVVVPTIYDACCNVVIEAAAMGCLVISSDQAGSDEMFKNGLSIIIHSSNIGAKDYAALLNKNIFDYGKMNKLGENAYEIIHARTWDVVSREIRKYYEDVLKMKNKN